MPWLLTSPGHQQPWYWLYWICRSILTWGSVLSTCVKSMWRNDMKCKYMFMLPQKNLTSKGLKSSRYLVCFWQLQVTTNWLFSRKHIRMYFPEWRLLIANNISFKFVPYGLIENITVLVQILAWCLIGNNALFEPMMAKFTATHMHHLALMS